MVLPREIVKPEKFLIRKFRGLRFPEKTQLRFPIGKLRAAKNLPKKPNNFDNLFFNFG